MDKGFSLHGPNRMGSVETRVAEKNILRTLISFPLPHFYVLLPTQGTQTPSTGLTLPVAAPKPTRSHPNKQMATTATL